MNSQKCAFSQVDLCVPQGLEAQDGLHLSVMLVDGSGTMRTHGTLPFEILAGFVASERHHVDAATRCVAIVRFGSQAETLLPLMSAAGSLPLIRYRAHGYTRLDATTLDALEALDAIVSERAARGLRTEVSLTVITDGEDSEGLNGRPRTDLIAASGEAARKGWNLDLYGIGIDARAAAAALGFPTDPAHAITLRPASANVRRPLVGLCAANEAA